jgi:hypothetical protein
VAPSSQPEALQDPEIRALYDMALPIIDAAIAEALAAERARVVAVARSMGATYPVAIDAEPGSERATRHADFPFADYLEDVPADRQGQTATQNPSLSCACCNKPGSFTGEARFCEGCTHRDSEHLWTRG